MRYAGFPSGAATQTAAPHQPAELPPPVTPTAEPVVETGADPASWQLVPAQTTHHDVWVGDDAVDPICGTPVSAGAAVAQRATEGGTVYFCSAHCAATFVTDPARYTAAGAKGES